MKPETIMTIVKAIISAMTVITGMFLVKNVYDLTTEMVLSVAAESEPVHEFENHSETDAPLPGSELSTAESAGLASPPAGLISTDLSTEFVDNAEPETQPAVKIKTYNGVSEGDTIIGELTYYDVCSACCANDKGITASGYIIRNGVQSYTASCNWLPFGAVIEVDGTQYTIRDRGGKRLNEIGRVDLFEPMGHKSALNNGRRKDIGITITYLP